MTSAWSATSPTRRGDVPRPGVRGRPGRGDLRPALPPVHGGAPLRGAGAGPAAAGRGHPPGRRGPERGGPAGGLPLPHAVPAQARAGVRDDAAGARGRARPIGSPATSRSPSSAPCRPYCGRRSSGRPSCSRRGRRAAAGASIPEPTGAHRSQRRRRQPASPAGAPEGARRLRRRAPHAGRVQADRGLGRGRSDPASGGRRPGGSHRWRAAAALVPEPTVGVCGGCGGLDDRRLPLGRLEGR